MSSFVTIFWIPNKMIPSMLNGTITSYMRCKTLFQLNKGTLLIFSLYHVNIFILASIGFVLPFDISQPCAKQLASDFIP